MPAIRGLNATIAACSSSSRWQPALALLKASGSWRQVLVYLLVCLLVGWLVYLFVCCFVSLLLCLLLKLLIYYYIGLSILADWLVRSFDFFLFVGCCLRVGLLVAWFACCKRCALPASSQPSAQSLWFDCTQSWSSGDSGMDRFWRRWTN